MADQKRLGRLKLMLDHVDRALATGEPDLIIVEKLLGDALSLVGEMRDPPDPYADRALRPGMSVSAADPKETDHV